MKSNIDRNLLVSMITSEDLDTRLLGENLIKANFNLYFKIYYKLSKDKCEYSLSSIDIENHNVKAYVALDRALCAHGLVPKNDIEQLIDLIFIYNKVS